MGNYLKIIATILAILVGCFLLDLIHAMANVMRGMGFTMCFFSFADECRPFFRSVAGLLIFGILIQLYGKRKID